MNRRRLETVKRLERAETPEQRIMPEKRHVSRMEHAQRHVQPGAFGADKGFVPVCSLTPQAVVDVADREGDALFLGQRAHEAEQGHAVGPARNSQREMLFAVQQLFPDAEAAHRL